MTELTTNWRKIQAVTLARAFSVFGSEMTTFSVILRERPQGAGVVSLLFVVGTLPLILFGPWSGWLADRFSTRQVIPIVNLVAAFAVISLTQPMPLWLLATVIFVNSAMSGISAPTFGALIPSLCKPDDISRAQGLAQSYFAFASLLAPATAGLLVGSSGYFWPFVIDAFTFVAIALAPVYLQANRLGKATHNGQKLKVMEGFTVIAGSPLIRSLVILVFVFILSIGVINVADIFFITKTLNATPLQYGLTGTAFSVGSIGGALLASVLKVKMGRQAWLTVVSMMGISAVFLAISLSQTWWPILIYLVIGGVANSALNSWGVGLMFATTDDVARGRLGGAVQSLFSAGSIIALLLGGITIDAFGPRNVILYASIASIVMLIVFSPSLLAASRIQFAPKKEAEFSAEIN